jgi:hypothetical protein
MEKMAVRFNESLTDATRGQFGQIAESLGTTVMLLQGMNSQFNATGTVLNELMSLAKRTVTDEEAHHESHIRQMTTVVERLLWGNCRPRRGTVESHGESNAAITCDMYRRMTELPRRNASVVEKNLRTIGRHTRQILDHAGTLTARSAEQLTQLLESHSQKWPRSMIETRPRRHLKTICRFNRSLRGDDGQSGKTDIRSQRNHFLTGRNYTIRR